MSTELTKTASVAEAVELALATGDIGKLSAIERVNYYNAVCKSVGVNPLTRPFEYITLNNKLTLYARRDATDQLRRLNGVSVAISKTERLEDVYVVTATARMGSDGDTREDTSTGAVSIAGLKGESLANALMKAETKAKRRVTLSIVGLGFLDETEIETIPTAKPVNMVDAAPEIPYTSNPESQAKIEAKIEAKATQPAPAKPRNLGEMKMRLNELAHEWYGNGAGIALNNHLKRCYGKSMGDLDTNLLQVEMGVYEERIAQRKAGVPAVAPAPFTDEDEVAQ
jgi:hypothetical protein